MLDPRLVQAAEEFNRELPRAIERMVVQARPIMQALDQALTELARQYETARQVRQEEANE